MPTKGPPPEPTVLKLARGNPGKRAINHEEPQLDALSATPPKGLPARAKAEWTRLAPELIAKGVLTTGDMSAFEQYCRLVSDVDAYEKLVKKYGPAISMEKGYANYLLKLRGHLRQQAAHIGLTPSSRSGVKAVKPKTAGTPDAQRRDRFFGGNSRRA